MIIPTKYTDLDLSIVRVSSLIVKLFEKNKVLSYDEVFQCLIDKVGEDVKHVYLSSLGFLYLLGMIEYHLKNDSIEFIGNYKNEIK
jgi:hypothetical protein